MRTIPITVSDEYVRGAGGNVGAAGSHDDVILRLAFGEMWKGTTRSIVWLDANGENPVVTALTTAMLEDGETEVYLVPIPTEPKKVAGQMKMTIKGATVSGEVEATATLTATARFTVMESDWDNDAEQSADITPTQAEQYQAELEAIKTTIADARSAATEAKASETAAALSETNAKASESAAATSEKAAADSAAEAAASEENAASNAEKAAASEAAAKSAQTAAASSAASAKSSETVTAENAATASAKAAEASASAASAASDAKTASDSRAAVEASATAAANSQTAAAGSASAAASSAATAQTAKTAAESAKTAAESAKTAAATSETNAASSAAEAAASAASISGSVESASASATAAADSAEEAASSAESANVGKEAAQVFADSAWDAKEAAETAQKAAESWAVGGTGTRTGEDTDNSKYWSNIAVEKAKEIEDLADGKGIMLIATYDPDKDGSVNEADVAREAKKLQTATNITIGSKTVSYDGTADVSMSLSDIGAASMFEPASAVNFHNSNTKAHSDIRELIGNCLQDNDSATSLTFGNGKIGYDISGLTITVTEKLELETNESTTYFYAKKIDVGGKTISNLATPTKDADATTKAYVDAVQTNLTTHTGDTTVHITAAERTAWNAKQGAITGAATTIASSNLTASRALVSDSSGKVSVSAVTSAELGYLDGVTSNVQTQLNAKASAATASVTIAASDWTADASDYYCAKTVSGVTSTNQLIVSPNNTAATITAWGKCGIYAAAQAANSITFRATKQPSESVVANILIIN